MNPRERILATAAFEPPDRPFMCETLGFWDETLEAGTAKAFRQR